jgi:hypothetical protein
LPDFIFKGCIDGQAVVFRRKSGSYL